MGDGRHQFLPALWRILADARQRGHDRWRQVDEERTHATLGRVSPTLRVSARLLLATLGACTGGAPLPAARPPPPIAVEAPPPAAIPVAPGHAIDLTAMDRTVRPGTDFYMFANGGWYRTAEIPADRPETGVRLHIREEVERRTKDILDAAALAKAGGDAQKMGDFYASYLDEPAIEARGVDAIGKTLDRIAKIADKRALAQLLGSQLRADVDAVNKTQLHTDHVLGLWVEQDMNDPSRYAPYLLQGGLGMPDRKYYLDDAAPMVALRAKYQTHVAAMLRLAGIKDADARAARILAFEKRLAAAHASREDSSTFVLKGNNPWTKADFSARAKGLDWDAFFDSAGLADQSSFIVWHPSAVVGLAALAKSEPLQTWRDYLTARALEHAAWFLPKALVDEHFAFYGKELNGVATPLSRWKRAIQLTNDALGYAVGKVYVERFFPAESKRAVEGLVQDLLVAFGKRIDALPWMTPSTKAMAKAKLATLKVGVGYPDVWITYGDLEVVRGEALANFERAELFEYRRNLKKLGHPVDRGEWDERPQIIGAINMPIRNALNFTAAALASPVFDPSAPAAWNYGSVGALIGHEISHGFDDQGAQFDAQGRVAQWWTPEDLSRFRASEAALVTQFDAYRPFPDVAVNGAQTLTENMADLAGLAAAYDAWRASLHGEPAPTQDGLSGDQQFFLAFAQVKKLKTRELHERMELTSNGHAPWHYRILTVRNLDAWYEAFDVKPSDALYLAPSARVRVW
jgi:putative endopeptidase